MIVMIVDSEVLVERGIFEVAVTFVAREKEGQGIVLRFPEEVAVACLLEFSCVCQGRAISEIFLFPVNEHGLRGSSS
jgi:hypothetical protein